MSSIESKRMSDSAEAAGSAVYTTRELRNIKEIKEILFTEYTSPSIELVRYFADQLFFGGQPESEVDRLGPIVRQAVDEFVNDRCHERYRSREMGVAGARGYRAAGRNQMTGEAGGQHMSMSAEEFEKCFIVEIG